MVNYPTRSRCLLADYPGYTCYGFYISASNNDALTVQSILDGTAKMGMYHKYYDNAAPTNGVYTYYHIVDNRIFRRTCPNKITPPFGSRVMLHPRCKVPATMLKKYEVINSVSQDGPEYIVLPPVFDGDVFADRVLIFVNDNAQVMISVVMPWMVDTTKLPKDPNCYLHLVRTQLSMTMPELFKYVPLDDKLHSIVEVKDDFEFMFDQGLLPEDKIVNEDSLFVGEDELTYDIFKSCYMMLQSDDKQMQRTALLTLGQHDCKRFTEILRWVFQTHENVVYDVKRGNKPFSYLHTRTTRDNKRIWKIREPFSRMVGRKLVSDLTGGQVRWENGVFMKPEGYEYKDGDLAYLAEHELN